MVAIYACAKEIASQGIKLIMIRRMIKSETLIKKRKQSHLLPQGIVREDNVHTLERMKLILINLAIPMDFKMLLRKSNKYKTPNKKELILCHVIIMTNQH